MSDYPKHSPPQRPGPCTLARAALSLDPSPLLIILAAAVVIIYTFFGGMEAVVWTDVVQSVVIIGGALTCALLLLFNLPDGPGQLFEIAAEKDKFSLGSFDLDLATKDLADVERMNDKVRCQRGNVSRVLDPKVGERVSVCNPLITYVAQ